MPRSCQPRAPPGSDEPSAAPAARTARASNRRSALRSACYLAPAEGAEVQQFEVAFGFRQIEEAVGRRRHARASRGADECNPGACGRELCHQRASAVNRTNSVAAGDSASCLGRRGSLVRTNMATPESRLSDAIKVAKRRRQKSDTAAFGVSRPFCFRAHSSIFGRRRINVSILVADDPHDRDDREREISQGVSRRPVQLSGHAAEAVVFGPQRENPEPSILLARLPGLTPSHAGRAALAEGNYPLPRLFPTLNCFCPIFFPTASPIRLSIRSCGGGFR